MYKRFILNSFSVCLTFFYLSVQAQSKVGFSIKDQQNVAVSSVSTARQASSLRDVVWPEDKIANNASKGLFIEEITVTPTGYNILYNQNYKKQIISKKLDYEFIKKGLLAGYALTEISNTPAGFILVMSDVPNAKGYGILFANTLTELVNNARTVNKQVFKIAHYNNSFYGLTKPLGQVSDQKVYYLENFPSNWVDSQIKKGYTLTDACYKSGKWFVLMTADAPSASNQHIILSKEWEAKSEWDKGRRFSRIVNAYDFTQSKNDFDRLYKSANVDFDAKKKDLAFSKYDQAITAYPYYYYGYYLRGIRSYNENRYDQTIKDYTMLIDKFKLTNPDYLMLRGFSYSKTNQYELALRDFEAFLENKVEVKDRQIVLAEAVNAQRELGNSKGALSYLDQLIQLKPTDVALKAERTELLQLVNDSKPTIVWDKPFYATTTVQNERLDISACVYLKGNKLKSYKILLNNKEVSLISKRGVTIEDNCDQKIVHTIPLRKGENILEIVLITNEYQLHSEKRKIIFK